MNKKQRRLGRGLEALLGATQETEVQTEIQTDASPLNAEVDSDGPRILPLAARQASTTAGYDDENDFADTKLSPSESRLFQLNVYEIEDNPFQPRRDFSESEIASLAESLKEHDMLQPILVRRVDDRFQLISGERRLRAAIQAGWSTVPAQIREADDRLVAELAIVENLQRKDLNPLEKALSFKRYLDEHDCKQEDLAARLKIDRSTIANLVRLLDLPRVVQDALRADLVSAGHARALLPLGNEQKQIEFCNRIQSEGWSVRDTERLVKEGMDNSQSSAAKSPTKKRTKSEQIQSLERDIRIALGTKVEIKQSSRGKGKIIVHFNSSAEFERLRALMSETDLRREAA